MAMLLGPANGSIMVRHVLDVREGALPHELLKNQQLTPEQMDQMKTKLEIGEECQL